MTTAAFGFREGHGQLRGVTVLDLSGYVSVGNLAPSGDARPVPGPPSP